ncbi:MAG: hypothetical protein ACKVZJ_07810 [Phycisphaerales bacterium]
MSSPDHSNEPDASPPSDLGSLFVPFHRPCVTCSYDLKGLPSAGLCPECGTSVEQSMRGVAPPREIDHVLTFVSDPCLCASCAYDLQGLPTNGLCPQCGTSVASSMIGAAEPVRPRPVPKPTSHPQPQHQHQPRPQPAPEPELSIISVSRPCISCLYDLKGLPIQGVCPECGTSVALSLRGNMLARSSWAYLATLQSGLVCVQAAVLSLGIGALTLVFGGFFAAAIAAALGQGGAAGGLFLLAALAGLVMSTVVPVALGLYGWWKVSTPDPHITVDDRGEPERRNLRAALWLELGIISIAALCLVASWVGPGTGGVAGTLFNIFLLCYFGALVLRYFLSLRYIRWLARRVPSEQLVRQTERLMWLGPVLMVAGALACFVGPIIAMVLYFNVVDRLRLNVKHIRITTMTRAARDTPLGDGQTPGTAPT